MTTRTQPRTEAEALAARQIAEGCEFPGVILQHYLTGPRVDVVAEHGRSWDEYGRERLFTRVTERKLWTHDGAFIALLAGHLPDGFEHHAHGLIYRLNLRSVDGRAAA